jgi:hypothetical protein
MQLNVSVVCSFLLLSDIPSYEYTEICLLVLLLRDTWIVFSFGCNEQPKARNILVYVLFCLNMCFHFS